MQLDTIARLNPRRFFAGKLKEDLATPLPDVEFFGTWAGAQRDAITGIVADIEQVVDLRQRWTCVQADSADRYAYRISCAEGQLVIRGDSADEILHQLQGLIA